MDTFNAEKHLSSYFENVNFGLTLDNREAILAVHLKIINKNLQKKNRWRLSVGTYRYSTDTVPIQYRYRTDTVPYLPNLLY